MEHGICWGKMALCAKMERGKMAPCHLTPKGVSFCPNALVRFTPRPFHPRKFQWRKWLRRQTTMLVSCSQCFWKGCICFISVYFHFSFQRKFNNHLKILTTTIWSTISRFYHCYFILRWNVRFFTFLFSTRNRLIRFHFFFLQDVW